MFSLEFGYQIINEALLDNDDFTIGKGDRAYTISKVETKGGVLQITVDADEDPPSFTTFSGLGTRIACRNGDGRIVTVEKYTQEF